MVTRGALLSAAGGTSAAGGAQSLSAELGAGRTGHGKPRAPHKHAALSHPAPTHRVLTRTQQNTGHSARTEPARTHHSRRTPHPPHAVRIAFHASPTHCKYSYNTHSHTLNPLGTRTPEDALLEQAPPASTLAGTNPQRVAAGSAHAQQAGAPLPFVTLSADPPCGVTSEEGWPPRQAPSDRKVAAAAPDPPPSTLPGAPRRLPSAGTPGQARPKLSGRCPKVSGSGFLTPPSRVAGAGGGWGNLGTREGP